MTSVSTDVRRGLIYAGLIIAAAGGARIATAHGVLGSDWPARAMMAVIGVFLMATGNAIPKTLTPLSACAYDPATLQRLQRQAGWTFTLAGAGVAIGWLVLPVPLANRLTLLLVPVTALCIVQLVRLRRAGRPA